MREEPAALGALRPSTSGRARALHEQQIRRLAQRLGYELLAVVDLDQTPEILATVRETEVDVVIIPSEEHLPPEQVMAVCDVVTVTPEATFARWGGYRPVEAGDDLKNE